MKFVPVLALLVAAIVFACGENEQPVTTSPSPSATDTPATATPTAGPTPMATPSATPDPRLPHEQVTYVGPEGEIRMAEADGANDTVFIKQPCEDGVVSWRPFPWSSDGSRFAYLCSMQDGADASLIVVDADGQELARATDVGAYKWAPDGAKIAMERRAGDWPDLLHSVSVLDVTTGDESIVREEALLLEWVGSDRIMLGQDIEFNGFSFPFKAYLHDLSGKSAPLPRFDNVREFWVSPDGDHAIVLQQWDEQGSGFRMAVYDFATGAETEIAESAIGYGSEHIPDDLLAFSHDGSAVYWLNGNVIPDSPLYHADLTSAVPKAEPLHPVSWLGAVSPGGRVAHLEPGDKTLFVTDALTGTSVRIGEGSQWPLAWRSPAAP